MTVKDLKYGDLIELYGDSNFRIVLEDEFNIYENTNQFVISEDSFRYDFNSITKIWREDKDGNYIYSNETLMSELRSWTDGCDPSENYTLKDLVQVPAEYRNVSLNSLQLACRDALGSFDHSKITHSFIYKMGIFLTQEELREIDSDLKDQGLNPDNYTLQTKIENHIKLPLNVLNVDLKVNPKGLSGTEFRDMINIKHLKGYRMCKYSVLTTSQLRTLRSKVLCALEDRTKWQAKKWKEIMSQIEEVAKYKHFKLS